MTFVNLLKTEASMYHSDLLLPSCNNNNSFEFLKRLDVLLKGDILYYSEMFNYYIHY